MTSSHSEEFECTFSDGFAHAIHMTEEIYIKNCYWCQNEKLAEEVYEEMARPPETRPEISIWMHNALQEATSDGHGNMVVDINTWNNLVHWAFVALDAPVLEKREQPNTIDMNRLGRAIHNLRWCYHNDMFHDIAHTEEEDSARVRLQKAYERAEEEEKILYGGNA